MDSRRNKFPQNIAHVDSVKPKPKRIFPPVFQAQGVKRKKKRFIVENKDDEFVELLSKPVCNGDGEVLSDGGHALPNSNPRPGYNRQVSIFGQTGNPVKKPNSLDLQGVDHDETSKLLYNTHNGDVEETNGTSEDDSHVTHTDVIHGHEMVNGLNRKLSIYGHKAPEKAHSPTMPPMQEENADDGAKCNQPHVFNSPGILRKASIRFKSNPSSPLQSPKSENNPHITALQNLFDKDSDKVVNKQPDAKPPVHNHVDIPPVTFSNTVIREESRESRDSSDSEEDFFINKHLDDVQRTVMSIGELSIGSQNDILPEAPFITGNLKFTSKSLDEDQFKKQYVVVPWETTPCDLTYFMERYWSMRSPKIVLSVMSGTKNEKIWKHNRLREQFKKGLTKAANSTEMWIISNGVDDGVASLVGEAVKEEKMVRTNSRINLNQLRPDSVDFVKKFQKLTVIGVVPRHKVVYHHLLSGTEIDVKVTNEGVKPGKNVFELNPHHTHYVLVEADTEENYVDFRFNFEKQLQVQLGRPRRYKRLLDNEDEDDGQIIETPAQSIPVVGLLIQGSPEKIDLVLFYLRNKMPVVIVKGSGGCADLLAFAFEEFQDKSDTSHKTPELLKMILFQFPDFFKDNDFARNTFRDKIVECASLAREDDRVFMTIVNTQGADGNLADLDKNILKALLKSEIRTSSRWREKAYKDLLLLLDWNKPDLAKSEIFSSRDFSKMRIDKTLFEKALIRKDREDFVTLFLDQGFQIHRYLNHKNFKYLFEKAEDSEFFTTVCLEGILGKNFMLPYQPLPQDFLLNDLNKLIAKLSGIKDFVQPYELSMNSAELYVLDPAVAERKAINCLIIWAVLLSRPKLAKVLWYRCDEPIPVALIVSNIYRELSKCPMERYQRNEMEECAKMFGNMALGVLDISFKDTSVQAYSMLSRPLADFNNKSTIEIAHSAYYLNFIAHQGCQKWLTKRLYGSIQVKECSWGICRLPYWFKILSSVWLIFPMFVWISFGRNKTSLKQEPESPDPEDDPSSGSDSDDEKAILPRTKSQIDCELQNLQRKKSVKKFPSLFRKQKKQRKVPLWKKFEMLWSAPITKFWTTQMFYFIYLGLFCLAVLWPTCGNFYLDSVVWVWTLIMLIEVIRHSYIQHQIHSGMSQVWNFFEITFISVFLILYLSLRIIPYAVSFSSVFVIKNILSVGLIFFFYRLPITYLPISPTLGPMLVRIKRMISIDLVSFVRMFLIFMISGGVTIQAILYPNYPLGRDLITRVLTRPLFAMFLTQIDDLPGHDCSINYDNLTSSYCVNDPFQSAGSHSYIPEPGVDIVHKCPQSSLGGYVITIQYLLICKLVLVTLLFVLFSQTNSKVDQESDAIWKFQRYMLIMDFEERPCLPPPLTIFNYIYLLIKFIHGRMTSCRQSCIDSCSRTKKKKELKHKVQKIKRSEDYDYWKKCSFEYVNSQEEQNKSDIIAHLQSQILQNMQDDMKFQRKMMKRMTDRVVELERMLHSNRVYLESISHKLDTSDVLGVSSVKGLLVHVASRQSPYPGTNITRFPVLDRYVPWEKSFDIYDPQGYTKPKDQYPPEEISLVDEDLMDLKLKMIEREGMTDEERAELPPLPTVNYMWNKLVTKKKGKGKQLFDRRSWITIDNEMVRYNMDPIGIPINPMGRTGLKGRGEFWRWGPNHEIMAVITRWRRAPSVDGQPSGGYMFVEGKKVLEFIAVRKSDGLDEGSFGLPGEYLHGFLSRYSALVDAFKKKVLDLHDNETKANFDQSDLVQFFSRYAETMPTASVISLTGTDRTGGLTRSMSHPALLSSITLQNNIQSRTTSKSSVRTDQDSTGYSATQIYRGYIDDHRNTDNAWLEAEVWNFHYDSGDVFDARLPEDPNLLNWKEISSNVKIFGNESVIVKEAAKILDAYY